MEFKLSLLLVHLWKTLFRPLKAFVKSKIMPDIDQIIDGIKNCQNRAIAKAISLVEDGSEQSDKLLDSLDKLMIDQTMVLGITGNPGAGKSTLTDRLIGWNREEDKRVGVIAIDPSSPISGGAIH